MAPLLSIVVVNWNSRDLLQQCLQSIGSSDSIQIVVIDNASTDASAEMLVREFPRVLLIRNEANRGFACANNQGWCASTAKFILFLNSDTVVDPDILTGLVGFMDTHPDAGAASPRLTRRDGRAQPFAFGGDPTPGYLLTRGAARIFLRRALHDWELREVQIVDWVSGACLIARRQALEQVDGFDENFFMYFEDNDLCLRLRKAGWKIYFNPKIAITHLGGATLGQNRARTQWYAVSLRYFYRKHYSFPARLALEIMLPLYRRMNPL